MVQFNTEAVVPFFTSTAGFALLWHNYGQTHLNPCDETIPWSQAVRQGDSIHLAHYTAKHEGVHEMELTMTPGSGWGGNQYNMTINGEKIGEVIGNCQNAASQRYYMKAGQT